MARMIPPYCLSDASPGERAVFKGLREDPVANEWTVLHSLGIAKHERQVEGEADFVVIVPGAGVIVIEVKSHRSVSRDPEGNWRLGNARPTPRGPFQQAQEAKHSIRDYLMRSQVPLRDVPIVHAVWFTGVRARATLPRSPEWQPWQVLDATDLEHPARSVARTLGAGGEHVRHQLQGFGLDGFGPSNSLATRIATTLRPRFELTLSPGDLRQMRRRELERFLDEQFQALDAAADNPQVLFTGAAGTGKTFLAVESVHREVAQGHRGRLLCFNRLLGKSLRQNLPEGSSVRAGTFHAELLRLAGMDRPPSGAGREFWEGELPERAFDGLAKAGSREVADFLIVDEIQDLATEPYLDLMDMLVEGGLRKGRVLMFGDFERQAIYENPAGRQVIRDRAPSMATFRLTANCRNRPRIGFQVNLLGQLTPGFDRFRREDDGVDPVIRRYDQPQEQSDLLRDAVGSLRAEGYELSEIVVLSPFGSSSVAATTADPWLRRHLTPADGSPPTKGVLRYSTIQAFKGLEAPAVVVTDLCDEGLPNFDALLYVGLTRATDRLTAIIETETLRGLLGGGL